MFRLCRYVRTEILKDEVNPSQPFPGPTRAIYQQGNLILKEIDGLPEGAVRIEVAPMSDGRIPLGDGHFIGTAKKSEFV